MQNEPNVYFKARKDASVEDERLWSRERAAELLGISASTLSNYELGVTKIVPPDAVVMMADLYKAPELKCYYCAKECPIGRTMPIPTKISTIELVALKVLKAMSQNSVRKAREKLIEISSDQDMTKDKVQTVMWLLCYLDGLIETLGELRLTCQKLLAAAGVNIKNYIMAAAAG